MTLNEARKIAEIVRTADFGCGPCVEELCEKLNTAGLGFKFVMGEPESINYGWFPKILVEEWTST